MSEPWSIGVDLGGTKVEVAHVTDKGNIVNRRKFPTNADSGPNAIIDAICKECFSLVNDAGAKPTAIGVGVAGQIHSHSGTVRFAPNLRWKEVPLQDQMSRALSLPVHIVNDVRAAAWGEWLFGAGEGASDLVCLFIGTGIGGGIVSGGRMMSGANNSAGELGHMTIELNGPQCTCGNRGCFEAIAGGWAIARQMRDALSADPKTSPGVLTRVGGDLEKISAHEIVAAAKAGDAFAQECINDAIDAIAAASVSIANAFNPARLILGGGLGFALPGLLEKVRDEVKKYALATARERLEIIHARLQNDAGVVGAAAYAAKKQGTP